MSIPKPGQTFSSYRAVCAFLGEPIAAGNSKKAQIARWRHQFTWMREGNKWIIVDQVDHIEALCATRGSRWSKYLDPHILLLLYSALHEFGQPAYTKTTLPVKSVILFSIEGLIQLGFCNSKYKQLREGELQGVDEVDQKQYFDVSFPRIYTYLVRAFNRLNSAGTIVYDRTFLVTAKEARLATAKERNDINLLKASLLRKYNKTEAAIIRSNLRTVFYNNLELLIQYQLGLTKAYQVHHLLFTEDSIAELPYISDVMSKRAALQKDLNEESIKLHLNLLREEPFKAITNLVIPTGD